MKTSIKQLSLLSLLVVILHPTYAQLDILISSGTQAIALNGTKVDKTSTIQDVQKIIGTESRTITKETATLYIYDSLGVNFVVKNSDHTIKKIDTYYSSSEEFETSPKSDFSGNLLVDDKPVLKDESIEEINKKLNNIFAPMSSLMPWHIYKNGDFKIVIAYEGKSPNKISSVYIIP